jgi:PAS domain S-box-containing protein
MEEMLIPSAAPDEAVRLETLHGLKILDTLPEERFDRITRIATRLFDVPIAIVSLIDANRQWFKSCQGLSASETPRGISFCAHAILGDDVFYIHDTQLDPRFSDNPLVTGDPHVRFYAGYPIAAANGSKLGTLCIADRKPRQMSEAELQLLRDLGYWVQTELSLVKGLQQEIARQTEMLQENERMFFGLIEGLPVGVFVLDATGKYYYSNRLAQKILGQPGISDPRPEHLPDQFHLYIAGTSQEYPAERMTSVRALRGETSEIDDLEVHRGSDVIPLQAWGAPIRNSKGSIVYAVAVFQDISHRRQAERRLTAQHAVTNILATSASLEEATPGILQAVCEAIKWDMGTIWYVDRKAGVLRCVDLWHSPSVDVSNFAALTRKFTFPSGMGLSGRVWASGEPHWIENVVEDTNFPRGVAALNDDLHSAFAFPILLRQNVIGVIEFFSRKIHKPDPDLLSVLGSLGTQIGQFVARSWAEKALQESEERYRLLTENSQDLIALITPEAKTLFASPSFLHMLGRHPAAIAETDFIEMVHAEDAEKMRTLLEEAVQSKTTQTFDLRLCKQDGTWLAVEGILSAISGSPKRLLFSGRNRSEDKPEAKPGLLKRLGF